MIITIEGEPIAQQRHRDRKGGGKYAPQARIKRYTQKQVLAQKTRLGLIDGPVIFIANYYCGRPKSHYGTGKNCRKLKKNAPSTYKFTRPDIDNYDKYVFDCFNRVVWHDDGQVVCSFSTKLYCDIDEKPRSIIIVKGLL